MSKEEEERKARRREQARVRQARWRGKNRWLGEQRRQACYGRSHEQLARVTNNAGEVREIEVLDPDSGKRIKILVDGRTRIGRVVLALWQQVEGRSEAGVEVPGF
jgi:hypothetical protein